MLKKTKIKQDGQAMVEFALILPLLIFIFIAIIDFGWIFGNTIIANNACRETARNLAINYTTAAMNETSAETFAELYIQNHAPILNVDQVNVVQTETNSGGITTSAINLELIVNIDVLSPLIAPFGDMIPIYDKDTDTISYDTDCTMRLE